MCILWLQRHRAVLSPTFASLLLALTPSSPQEQHSRPRVRLASPGQPPTLGRFTTHGREQRRLRLAVVTAWVLGLERIRSTLQPHSVPPEGGLFIWHNLTGSSTALPNVKGMLGGWDYGPGPLSTPVLFPGVNPKALSSLRAHFRSHQSQVKGNKETKEKDSGVHCEREPQTECHGAPGPLTRRNIKRGRGRRP